MTEVRKLRIETRHAFWRVGVSDRPDGYRCEFYGTTPTMADMGRGVTVGTDLEALLAETRHKLEAIDGPIERET